MEGVKTISIMPFSKSGIHGLCDSCGKKNKGYMHEIKIGSFGLMLCKGCLAGLFHEAGRALHKVTAIGDTVWELTLCGDNNWRIFPMVVKDISVYGTPRRVKGKDVTVWNIYAESKDGYTYMYKNFYDVGKSLFFTKEAAKLAREQCQNGQ